MPREYPASVGRLRSEDTSGSISWSGLGFTPAVPCEYPASVGVFFSEVETPTPMILARSALSGGLNWVAELVAISGVCRPRTLDHPT